MRFYSNQPQIFPQHHVLHCIDSLRQNVLCNAEDTPLWSDDSPNPTSGVGQARQSRNWDDLEKWARKCNACFKYGNHTLSDAKVPEVERYVYCPKGSPYRKKVEEVFGSIYGSGEYD